MPTDPGDLPVDGNVSPLSVGDYGFSLDSTYFLDRGADLSGGPQRASAVSLCIRIDAITDTARGEYRITGGSTLEPTLADSTGQTPDRASIDSALSPLWMKSIAYPVSETLRATRTFSLQSGLRPDGDLARFPFIEVRASDGWDGFDDAVADSLQWFRAPPLNLDDAEFFNSSVFDLRSRSGDDTLLVNLVWRETADESYPAEIRGPVLHALRIEYTPSGALSAVREWILPDDDPAERLDADQDYGLRCDREPCLFALVSAEDFGELFCAF